MLEKNAKKYVSDDTRLISEWNLEKNIGTNPSQLTVGSHKKVWWRCDKSHEWQASIDSRSRGNGCPYCAGQKVMKGYNDLQTTNHTLAKEWNYEKNKGLTPAEVMANSGKKVWWKCGKGHEWQAVIRNRNRGNGCPYCSGRLAIEGYNDLQTTNHTLAKEWNYERNAGFSPEKFTSNSRGKVWWKCSKGHEWQATINNRSRGSGCPYCAGKKVLKGYNDLQTINPILAQEWNYERNHGLTAMEVTSNSSKKVWWKCKKGHEWQAVIGNRHKGNNCPICTSERNTSLPEYVMIYYLEKYGIETIHSYREQGYELDIYIPTRKIAIEYDGYYWHKDKREKDLEKNLKCKQEGIKLYRIREGLPSLNDSSIDYVVQKNKKDLSKIIKMVLSDIIGTSVDVNIKRDAIAIESLREYTEKENSILYTNLEIAQEWNYERNAFLRPEHFTSNSGKKVWWKCSMGHEWQATIGDRNNGSGCPYCASQKVMKGYNDLQTINPALAEEWSYDKNGEFTPSNIMPNSNKKVWWKCSKGHEWQAAISDRSKEHGCPYCSGRRVVKGESDLETVNPILAKEWNYERNNDLKPEHFTSNSGKKVWWKCNKGHEWQATIVHRNNGRGCPYCAGKKVLKGFNDLQTVNPTLAKEWYYENNIGLTPMDVLSGSGKKVWWKCSKGHEWQAVINSRNRGHGCPTCATARRLNLFEK